MPVNEPEPTSVRQPPANANAININYSKAPPLKDEVLVSSHDNLCNNSLGSTVVHSARFRGWHKGVRLSWALYYSRISIL